MATGQNYNSGISEWEGSDLPSELIQSLSTYSLPQFESGIRWIVENYGNSHSPDLERFSAALSFVEGMPGLGTEKKEIVSQAYDVLQNLQLQQRQKFLANTHIEENAMFGGGIYEDSAVVPDTGIRVNAEALSFQADPNHATERKMEDRQNFFEGPYTQASMYGNYLPESQQQSASSSVGNYGDDYTDDAAYIDDQAFDQYASDDYNQGQDYPRNDVPHQGRDYPQNDMSHAGAPRPSGNYRPQSPPRQASTPVNWGNIITGIGRAAGSVIGATQGVPPGAPGSAYPPAQFIPPGATPQNYWPQQEANARTAVANQPGRAPGAAMPIRTATVRPSVVPVKATPAKSNLMRNLLIGGGVAAAVVGGYLLLQQRAA